MILFLAIALVGLLISSYVDIRQKEVPDWVSYGSMFIALGVRLIFYINSNDYNYLLEGVIGFVFFLAIGYAMYYAGQWGGGDSKLLMGIGALVGMQYNEFGFLLMFFVNMVFIGAIYGLVWSVVLAIKEHKKFSKTFSMYINDNRKIRTWVLVLALALILLSFLIVDVQAILIIAAGLAILMYYLFLFSKAVEDAVMVRTYKVSNLTEGDWIAEDVKVKGNLVCRASKTGITKNEIMKLKKAHITEVLVKEGIAFVPSILIAFIVTWIFGNWFLLL